MVFPLITNDFTMDTMKESGRLKIVEIACLSSTTCFIFCFSHLLFLNTIPLAASDFHFFSKVVEASPSEILVILLLVR